MLSTMDLRQVLRHQEALRREADESRLAATHKAKDNRSGGTLRVLRLRLSPAA
jgi:hypothetical protein